VDAAAPVARAAAAAGLPMAVAGAVGCLLRCASL
jgi:hypothetical protein